MKDHQLIDPDEVPNEPDSMKNWPLEDWPPNYKTVLRAMVLTPFYVIPECIRRGPLTIVFMPVLVPVIWIMNFGSILGQWMTRDFSTGAYPTGCLGSLFGICLVIGTIISLVALLLGIKP